MEPGLWGLIFGEGAKKSGPAFRLKVCLSWVCVFGPGLFLGGAKGPDPVSGLGSACLGSACSNLVSGLGSGCLGGLDFGVWAFGSGGFGVWGLDFGV